MWLVYASSNFPRVIVLKKIYFFFKTCSTVIEQKDNCWIELSYSKATSAFQFEIKRLNIPLLYL